MLLEDNQYYKKRNGAIVGPVIKINDINWDFWIPTDNFRCYTKGGKTNISGWIDSEHDLVEKVII